MAGYRWNSTRNVRHAGTACGLSSGRCLAALAWWMSLAIERRRWKSEHGRAVAGSGCR